MEKNRNVYLEGMLTGIGIVPSADGHLLARATLRTAVPKTDAGEKQGVLERVAWMSHTVLLKCPAEGEPFLRSLCDDIRTGKKPVFCSVNGRLDVVSDRIVVSCPDAHENLKRKEMLKIRDNNRVEGLEGTVSSVTVSDNQAVIRLKTGSGIIPLTTFPGDSSDTWKMVREGRIQRGNVLSVSGPLLSFPVSDGKRDMDVCVLSCRHIEKIRMAKTVKKSGPTL